MSMFNILDISAAGMDVQQARLAVAASNLANSQTTSSQGSAPYQPLAVIVRTATADGAETSAPPVSFEGADASADPVDLLPRPAVAATVALDAPPRLLYNPGHPDADSRGFVSLPGVDPITSMMDLISISRGYEANLRAFDVTRTLLQKTLDAENRR
jgi:flagellar basal-body rod protein FlgC